MSKRIISLLGLSAMMLMLTGVLTAAAPEPVPNLTLVQGLPSVMKVCDTGTVVMEQTAKAVNEATNPTTGALGILLAVATGGASLVTGLATQAAINATSAASKGARQLAEDYYAELDPKRRYDRFNQEVVPGVVESFVNLLSLEIKVRGQAPVRIDSADFTLVSTYQAGVPLAVSLRANLDGRFKRADIEQLILKSTVPLPASFRAFVNSARLIKLANLFFWPPGTYPGELFGCSQRLFERQMLVRLSWMQLTNFNRAGAQR